MEVWFEKDALLGVFERPADQWRVPYFSCRGYASDSEVWAAAQRLRRMSRDSKRVVVLHFGDHDPSGLDMTRDIEARLALFGAPDIRVKRIALTFTQVQEHNPPPNPAKETDSRFEGYRAQYGDESWELDALDPATLAGLVAAEVGKVLDRKAWVASMAREKRERERLTDLSSRYADVTEFLRA